ncbi:uncharacterized protein (TIGR01732 family) [Bacillus licheniformis]|nr:uncharacterized protein (TIGR01732 family) [Bacillus licheniformis]GIN43441.1 hypothetical protein J23TS8_10080 [Bacillus paralicheniformis]GIN48137.1 hypothetical protein J25TS1_13910 [Bacillus paralicheniformis]GIN54373.1 hypothetical protein J36TS2_32670 [Bacillus paralicheniformis]GIN77594.1 hypothetical protein J41TS8_26350 [Bacillus sp. J41TS8]
MACIGWGVDFIRKDDKPVHYSHYCCPTGGYGYGFHGRNTFVLIVVLFILLIIVGAAFIC